MKMRASLKAAAMHRMKKHPGFKAVQAGIAQQTNPKTGEPYGEERAGAILASRSRGASAAAKRRNPRLKRV